MTSAREWWRRATAAVKDRRSICLTKVAAAARCSSGPLLNPDLEAAVIRATSHDERAADQKSAGRVLGWARASPALLEPLMWALARRAGRTRSWAVALKALMLAHGLLLLLLRSGASAAPIGRLPFDLSDFRDRSAQPARAWGFSAFVRAYFDFLDRRSAFLGSDGGEDELERVERMQELLDLLMRIRPYADGMGVGLVLEAMECVVIEIFDVYSAICSGIAGFLVGIIRSSSAAAAESSSSREEKRRRGVMGIRALRKAGEQSTQLAAYFELCRGLGVMNMAEFPAVESIPEEDIMDLNKLVLGGISGSNEGPEEEERKGGGGGEKREKGLAEGHSGTVVSKNWLVFEDETGAARREYFGNPFVGGPPSWEQRVHPRGFDRADVTQIYRLRCDSEV